jgi:hypothetical protein
MLNEAVLACRRPINLGICLEVLRNLKNVSQYSKYPGRELNSGLLE